MSESLGLRFLYRTVPGRLVLKALVHPGLSRMAGRFLDSRCSRLLIGPFLRSNRISLEGIQVPEGGFPSFNACFSRKRRETPFDPAPEHFCSPCDSLLSVLPIGEDSTFLIKHSAYSLAGLLKDPALAERYRGGTALIFRLTPAHYHRYHFVDDGQLLEYRELPGALHCVRPIAMERFPVFLQNSRAFTRIASRSFGELVQMEVGAMLVGRICNPIRQGNCCRGQEKGWFEYGGSTVILLVQQGKLRLKEELLRQTADGAEAPVRLGQWIGTTE